jgi:hypothetical protein
MPTGQQVADYLGRADSVELVVRAEQYVDLVTEFVRAYTRDRGFDLSGQPSTDIAAVILTATARLLENPTNTRQESVGDVSQAPGRFDGFTLPELAVLHRYRRRLA